MQHLKIAIVTETFPPEINGVSMTFGVIAAELGRRGHIVTVYRPHRPDLPGNSVRRDFREVSMPGIPIPGYALLRLGLPARGRLKKLWREDPPDLVHVVTEGPLGATAVSAARALKIPVTSSFHTNFHQYASSYGFALFHHATLSWLRRVHNRTCRTFVPTKELTDELAGLGFKNLRPLSRGIDLRQFSPSLRDASLRAEWGAGPDDPVVLHVGRMATEKNYPHLFKCYAAMRAANPRTRFVLVGDGPLRARLQADHPDCIFTGFMSRDNLARHYASADIYIHASLSETFGNVLTEAMGSGLAVAGFDYAAARLFVRHGENGLVAPCDQPAALEAAAVRLVSDDALRLKLRTAAPVSVAHQSWENVVARFESDLVATVDESRPPVPARFLVLSASYGEGHNAAARNLAFAVNADQGPGTARVVDIFALTAPRLDAFSRSAYLSVINRVPKVWSALYGWLDRSRRFQVLLPKLLKPQIRRLAELIACERPAVICSTYPVYAFMIEQMKRDGLTLPPHYNVVTDSISINSLWWGAPCAGWFVPNAESAAVLHAAGVSPQRVHDCGFPTPVFFAENEDELAPPPLAEGARPRVLFIAHSGVRGVAGMAERLIADSDWELTFAVGRDEAMRHHLERAAAVRVAPVKILGWTDQIPRLMMTHHVVVSKAGGATTQEAIAARCPMIVSQIVPGQEEGNYELLRRHGVGAFADTPDGLMEVCRRAFADKGAVWSAWHTALQPLARPHAAAVIARQVLKEAGLAVPELTQ
jgi:glycosyltransferase involved in cell wall biosynthesis/UDP-N-acetylglucosamine:LPS N-acetylglucosamine transferase